MPSEFELHQASKAGDEAKSLLESKLLRECFDKLKRGYIEQLMATDATQSGVRDKYWMAARITDVVLDHLTVVLSDGVVAKSDLAALAQEGERRKRFSII